MKDFESRSNEKETQTAGNGWEELAKIAPEDSHAEQSDEVGRGFTESDWNRQKTIREHEMREFMKGQKAAEAKRARAERIRKVEADFSQYGADGYVHTNLRERISDAKKEYEETHISEDREYVFDRIIDLKEQAVEYGKARVYVREHDKEERKKVEDTLSQAEKKMKREHYTFGSNQETTVSTIRAAAYKSIEAVSEEALIMSGLEERYSVKVVKQCLEDAEDAGNKKRAEALTKQLQGLGYDREGRDKEGVSAERDFPNGDMWRGKKKAISYTIIRLALANINTRRATKKALKKYGIKKFPPRWDSPSVTSHNLTEIVKEIGLDGENYRPDYS